MEFVRESCSSLRLADRACDWSLGSLDRDDSPKAGHECLLNSLTRDIRCLSVYRRQRVPFTVAELEKFTSTAVRV